MTDRRIFVDHVAIACWIVLWVGTAKVGMELGKRVMDPDGRDPLGYLILVVFIGSTCISPVGFACSLFFLRMKRHMPLFIVSAVPIGLAATLWSLISVLHDYLVADR